MGKKQHSSGPGNRRPGRPDSAPQRGGKPFNASGDNRGSDNRRPFDDRRASDDRRSDDRRPSFGRREGGNDFPSRPPFGRPTAGGKPGFGKGSGSRPFGGADDRRFGGRTGDDRRDARPPRSYDKPAERDDAQDFMRGRLNKPDFKGLDRSGDQEAAPRRSFDRRPEGDNRPRRSFGGDRPGGFGGDRASGFGGNRSSYSAPRSGSNKFDGGESRFNREERPPRRFDDESADRPVRPARRFEDEGNDRPVRPARPFERDAPRPERRFDRDDRGPRRFEGGEQRPERGSDRRFGNDDRPSGAGRFGRPSDDKPRFGGQSRFERPERGERPSRDDRAERGDRPERYNREERKVFGRQARPEALGGAKPRGKRFGEDEQQEAPSYKNLQYYEEDKTRGNKRRRDEVEKDDSIRLNRYIANAGICSRREADQLIEAGEIRVNGEVVTELGYKVQPSDTVHYGKTNLKREKQVYVLLNKPKDFLTTTDDPDGRKTVMELVKNASKERIFPVGRLDRNTTGLLLFTNDGEVAQKLSHPSHRNKKVYQVELDKDLTEEHLAQIAAGVELEDGKAEVDDVAVVAGNPRFVGIEIHIGRNRIVRRIFEHLGYDVKSLDRVQYAGLTKKDLPRGHWRYLNEKEVIRLKYFM